MKINITREKIHLIISDIDNTLLDSNHMLQEPTRLALQRCALAGIAVTLATGKNWDAACWLAEELDIRVPVILSNGAILRQVDGSILEKERLPWPALQTIMQECEQGGYDLAINLDEDVYILNLTHNLAVLEDFGSTGMIEVGSWQVLWERLPEAHKCMILDRQSPQNLVDLENRLRVRIGESVEFCQSLPDIFDIMPKGVHKGRAMLRICDHMGIRAENVIAIGDGNNDAEMLSWSGLGVAVANASDLAKASADVVVPSNDENGPAQLLEYLLST